MPRVVRGMAGAVDDCMNYSLKNAHPGRHTLICFGQYRDKTGIPSEIRVCRPGWAMRIFQYSASTPFAHGAGEVVCMPVVACEYGFNAFKFRYFGYALPVLVFVHVENGCEGIGFAAFQGETVAGEQILAVHYIAGGAFRMAGRCDALYFRIADSYGFAIFQRLIGPFQFVVAHESRSLYAAVNHLFLWFRDEYLRLREHIESSGMVDVGMGEEYSGNVVWIYPQFFKPRRRHLAGHARVEGDIALSGLENVEIDLFVRYGEDTWYHFAGADRFHHSPALQL